MKRRSFLTKGVPAAAAAGAAACGKDDATGIAGPGPVPDLLPGETLLTVRGGGDNRVTAGAIVEVAGGTYTADPNGQVRLQNLVGAVANIAAPGHINPRVVRLAAGLQDVHLWYLAGTSLEYVRFLVYRAWDRDVNYPLLRLPQRALVSVLLSDELCRDGAAVAAFEEAVAEANRLVGAMEVSFQLIANGTVPQGGISFRVFVNPNDPAVRTARAATYRSHDARNWITGGDIVYANIAYACMPDVGTHELGHAAGLMHSLDSRDLMAVGHTSVRFSENELRVAEAMATRLAGNTWTDADPGVIPTATASALDERRLIIVD